MKKWKGCIYLLVLCFVFPSVSMAVQFIEAPPLSSVVKTVVGPVQSDGGYDNTPIITWGGDEATILGNGNSATTTPGSIFGQAGLQLRLQRVDDFKKQVENYLSGKTPFLRGTMGMINMALEVAMRDPRTAPIIFYNMTRSTGGDCLVVKSNIKTLADLKGKTIALQAYGPHVDWLVDVLSTVNLTMRDVNIRWVKDLTGTDNTPTEALHENEIDAAFVIIPDGLALTSNGTVGTGSEGSVKGARIIYSTKTADNVIFDVYAVRSDYFDANKDKIKSFTHGLLLAEQDLRQLFKERSSRPSEYKEMIKTSAKILLDSEESTADAEGLYADCTYVGFRGNVKFFGDEKWLRSFSKLNDGIQSAFVTAGLLSAKVSISHAMWNYDELRSGLLGIDDVETPRFKVEEVARIVEQKRSMGTLGDSELDSSEIFFEPNQNHFTAEKYSDSFNKLIRQAASNGGAVIIVEGHSDPLGYLKKVKAGESQEVLRRNAQAAKNLSVTRAMSVRDSIIQFASNSNISIDQSQFTVIGHGFMNPKTGMCGQLPCPPKTNSEWLSNMRVVFRLIQVEAEESVFSPLD